MLLLSELTQASLAFHCRLFFQALFGACNDFWQSFLLSLGYS